MANIILDATKSTGVSSTVTLNIGDQIQLSGFELSQAQQVFVNESGQLVIVLTDGTQFLVTNFAQNLAENPEAVAILSENGETISYSDVIASFVNNAEEVEDIEPALGEATPAAVTGAASTTIGEGSNAAENFDLFGAGFGVGEVVTSDAPEIEAQTQDAITTQNANPPLFVEVGPNANNASVTGNEDTTFNLNIPAPTDVDSDDATLSITVTTLPDAAAGVIQLGGTPITIGQVLTPAELTSLTFVPTADFNGDATFGYNVSDLNNSTPSVHTITVTGVDDIPVFAGPSSSTLDEDAAATDLNVAIPTDADTPYGDVLTMSITTPVANFNGTVTLDGTAVTDGQVFTPAEFARLQYTPSANYFGTFNIDYTVTDSTGNTVSNTHTVNVNSVNDAPVTVDSSSTQAEDSSATALNIPTPIDVEGDAIITIINAPFPTEGVLYYADGVTPVQASDVLTVAQLTSLTFVPAADFNGTAEVNYTISDGMDSSTATHTITVTPVNDAPVATDSTSSQTEDSTDVALGITAPTDIDDASLTAVIATLPTDGVLKFANGTLVTAGVSFDAAELNGLTFTPNADFNGTVTINYAVEDAAGLTDTATHTVTVTAENDAPVATNSTSAQDEDTTAVDLNITAPTDIDGDTLTITIDALPTNGTLYYADGTTPVGALDSLTVAQLTSLKFTPNADFNGDVAINYTVNDGTVTTGGTHTVAVNPVNDAPVAVDSTSTQAEDSTDIALGITAPTDIDDSSLTAVIATLPTDGVLKFANGTLVVAGASFDAAELNSLTFTPNADFNGTVAISYTVEDAAGLTDTATHTVTVTAENDAPTVTNSTSSQDEDSTAIDLNITAPTDIDGDTLTITLDALPTDGTLYYADGTTPVPALAVLSVSELTSLKFTPNANFNGDVTINYTVNDGTATTGGTHTVTVNSIEDAPEVTDSTSIQDEDSVDITLGINLPTDGDNDTLYAEIATLPTDGTLKFADGTLVPAGTQFLATELPGITFTPNANFLGTVAINYTVTDNNTTPVAGTHTVTVNNIPDEPVVVDSSSNQDEDSSLGALGIPTPTDPDGDALTIITTLPTDGTLYYADGVTPVANGASLTVAELTGLLFTPNADFNGTVSFTYTVSDSDPLTADVVGTHTITVNPVNDAPDVTNSSSSQAEDSVDGALNIPAPTDIDGDALQFRFTSIPNGTLKLADGTVVVAGTLYDVTEITGLTFTPNADFNGTANLNYEVIDGTDATAGTHTVTVTAGNDAPETTNSTSTQNEDTTAVDLNITAPTDIDGDTLTITIDALPANGTLYYADGTTVVGSSDTLTVAQLTSLRFTPDANFNGSVAINYTVSDGTTTTGGTHTVTVNPVNDAPTVVSSTSTQAEDSVNGALNIPAPTDIDGDALQFRFTSIPNGTLKLADGTVVVAGTLYNESEITGLTFTPNADFNGTVNLNYVVTDGTDSTNGTHTVTVGAVNDAPETTNSTSTQNEDTTAVDLNITAPTDIENDTLTITIDALPTDGTLYYANGTTPVGDSDVLTVAQLTTLKFTPNADFNGSVAINYTVSDGNLTTGGTHTVTVNPVNDAPVVTNSTSTQAEDSSNIVLGIPVATDVDGDALRFSVSSLPSGGTFTFTNGDALQAGVSYDIADIANIRFTPNADFNGTVTLNYSVTDGVVAGIPGSHTITVSPVNDAPVADNSTSTQDEDTSATLGIPTPTDVDGDALFATIATLPINGTLTFANGSAVQAGVQFSATELNGIVFTPNLNYNGTVVINYTVTDGSLTDSATHTITVNPVADDIITSPDDLVDTTSQIDFSSILRTAEIIDCVTPGSYSIDAEYRYDSVLAGTPYSYELPDSTFVSSDGSPLTYSATYTYNGNTYNVPTSGGWVNVDPTSGDLSGNIPTNMAGLVTFTFTATTPEGLTSSKSITYNFMSQAQYNAIDVIGPKFGNYVLPENTSDNLMIGMNEAGILRYDLLSTGKGVTADLDRGYVDKNNGYVDLIDGFKEFQATNYNDTVTAEDGKKSYVYGNAGNDTIISSSTGDYLNGGSGSDTISYQNATSAVSLNLANGSNNKGDTLVSFENVIGSDHNDSLVGSSGANYMDGGAGRDAIYGQAGNDTIIFDKNDSTLSGGSGFDTLVISDANSSYGNDIDLSRVAGGTVNISGFEEINMDNTTYNETLHMNVGDLLSSASGHEIRIKGDLIMDFQGANTDDKVQIHDKTAAQINAAERGTTTVDGTRYEVYDFGNDGRLLVEFGLDILDASGNVV